MVVKMNKGTLVDANVLINSKAKVNHLSLPSIQIKSTNPCQRLFDTGTYTKVSK